ncbi:hypothetical protein MT418_007426 [Batrachochytrium dendrobatidis]
MSTIHCFFCGGKECKYENWRLWTTEKYVGVNAIDGLFCNWITDNILAMQRPSTRLMKEYGLISKFQELDIRSIFNLQESGEHAMCGDGNEIQSGFSYLPENWMDNAIFYYNFGWTDMETPDCETMMNIVQVMAYALSNGSKIAVHCHAGLGRTGLSIACYLVYGENMPAETAILQVRSKRPLSVQTKKQVLFVTKFELYLRKLRLVFPACSVKSKTHATVVESLSLASIVQSQKKYLHGVEQRNLRFVPKLIYRVIERIIRLCTLKVDKLQENTQIVVCSILAFEGLSKLEPKMIAFQADINDGSWGIIDNEFDIAFLMNLMLYFITSLSTPIISNSVMSILEHNVADLANIVADFDCVAFQTLNYMMSLFRRLPNIPADTLSELLERIAILISSHRSTIAYPYVHWMKSPISAAKIPPKGNNSNLKTFQASSLMVRDAIGSSTLAANAFTQSMSRAFQKSIISGNATPSVSKTLYPDQKSESTSTQLSPSIQNHAVNNTLSDVSESNASINDSISIHIDSLDELSESSIRKNIPAPPEQRPTSIDSVSMVESSTLGPSPAPASTNIVQTQDRYVKVEEEEPCSSCKPLVEWLKFIHQNYDCADETRAVLAESLVFSHPGSPTLNIVELILQPGFDSHTNLAKMNAPKVSAEDGDSTILKRATSYVTTTLSGLNTMTGLRSANSAVLGSTTHSLNSADTANKEGMPPDLQETNRDTLSITKTTLSSFAPMMMSFGRSITGSSSEPSELQKSEHSEEPATNVKSAERSSNKTNIEALMNDTRKKMGRYMQGFSEIRDVSQSPSKLGKPMVHDKTPLVKSLPTISSPRTTGTPFLQPIEPFLPFEFSTLDLTIPPLHEETNTVSAQYGKCIANK